MELLQLLFEISVDHIALVELLPVKLRGWRPSQPYAADPPMKKMRTVFAGFSRDTS
jgi:hypothetical protein